MKRFYLVDLKASSGWNGDFVADCKRCNCLFEVADVKRGFSGESYIELIIPNGSKHTRPTWNHRTIYGKFVDPFVIDEGLFEI